MPRDPRTHINRMQLKITQRRHKEIYLEPTAIVVRVCGGAP